MAEKETLETLNRNTQYLSSCTVEGMKGKENPDFMIANSNGGTPGARCKRSEDHE